MISFSANFIHIGGGDFHLPGNSFHFREYYADDNPEIYQFPYYIVTVNMAAPGSFGRYIGAVGGGDVFNPRENGAKGCRLGP